MGTLGSTYPFRARFTGDVTIYKFPSVLIGNAKNSSFQERKMGEFCSSTALTETPPWSPLEGKMAVMREPVKKCWPWTWKCAHEEVIEEPEGRLPNLTSSAAVGSYYHRDSHMWDAFCVPGLKRSATSPDLTSELRSTDPNLVQWIGEVSAVWWYLAWPIKHLPLAGKIISEAEAYMYAELAMWCWSISSE